jgi:peptidoglycan/xylan/chitin deacetylase (PgdA/CDA1 family)
MSTKEKIIYLSFDDGPHPEATPFVLDTLKPYNAKATFFCIGKNVEEHKDIYRRMLDEGHRPGNHTHNHLNGWKVSDKDYFDNVMKASRYIDSFLFRPPYGKISGFQVRYLQNTAQKFRIIMWDVLSGDFDIKLSPDDCTYNVVRNTRNGSIVVFHDSEKAFPRLKTALPKMLEFFSEKGFRFEVLPL